MRRDYQFPDDVMDVAFDGMFKYPHPLVQLRFMVVWLKSNDLTDDQIARFTRSSRRSVQRHLAAYHDSGLDALKSVEFHKPQSELAEHRDTLDQHFRDHPPRSVAEARDEIERLTGIRRGLTQVRTFLRNTLNMRPRKTGLLPAKADADKQQQFLDEELKPLLAEAERGESQVWFVDAAHFQFGSIMAVIWCVARIFVRVGPSRKRWSVLAALNPLTLATVSVSTAGSVTSQTVQELIEKLREAFPTGKITLVLDNARYQKCKLVEGMAWLYGVELLYLPPYSPNLNLIERLWKFIRKEVIAARPRDDFGEFALAIDDAVAETATTHREALRTLISTEFQSFKNVPTLAA